MSKPKVSIVLPVYNGQEFIEESINSILNQTYSSWELIIVNDCSTDGTLTKCQAFANIDNRIRIISNETNQKLPKSLNIGFRNAVGEYYTWTSDDNLYKNNAIERMLSTLESDPDLAMVYADYSVIDSCGKTIENHHLLEPENIVSGNVIGACFMYSKKIAKMVGDYDADLFLAEDYDYWIRILKNGKILHINENLYFYRRHSSSLTETKKALIDEQTYKAIEKNFYQLYCLSIKSRLVNRFFDHYLSRSLNNYDVTKKNLISIDKGYILHLFFLKCKNILRLVFSFNSVKGFDNNK